jgi:predicted ATPase
MVVPEHAVKALKEDLLIHHLCEEITLAPLSKADIAEYLGAKSLSPRLPVGFAELIYRHSEGNPLFMVAALDHLTARGLISRENGQWRLRVPLEKIDIEVPETLRQVIEAQIDHLTPEEQRTLEVASVAGPLFSAKVVAAAMKVNAELLEELFERLSRRSQIVRAADSQQLADGQDFEFVHALYREVLYRRQTPSRRASLHLSIGQSLEDLSSQRLSEVAAELAVHFEHGGDWQRAIKYLRLAADKGGERFEPLPAAEILEHALELVKKLPDAERGASETGILEKLAGIYVAAGDIRVSETYAALSAKAAHYSLIDVEVRALVEWAFIASWASSERGLELLEQAFRLVTKLDPVKHLPAYATCLFFRLLCVWNPQHAEEYGNAIGEIRKLGSSHIVGPHLLDYSFLPTLKITPNVKRLLFSQDVTCGAGAGGEPNRLTYAAPEKWLGR